jgi:hypothetical protein
MEQGKQPNAYFWIKKFLLELILYSLLVIGYFFVALRFLGKPLEDLYIQDLTLYALVSLGLIVMQGVLLDFVVTFLLDFFGLDRLE